MMTQTGGTGRGWELDSACDGHRKREPDLTSLAGRVSRGRIVAEIHPAETGVGQLDEPVPVGQLGHHASVEHDRMRAARIEAVG